MVTLNHSLYLNSTEPASSIAVDLGKKGMGRVWAKSRTWVTDLHPQLQLEKLIVLLIVLYQVAQYIRFPLPLLESILHKLNEEEEQEIQETEAK